MTKTQKLALLDRFVRSRIRREDVEALFSVEIRTLNHITAPTSSPDYKTVPVSNQHWIGMTGSSMMDMHNFVALNPDLSDEVKELIALYMAARSLDEV